MMMFFNTSGVYIEDVPLMSKINTLYILLFFFFFLSYSRGCFDALTVRENMSR